MRKLITIALLAAALFGVGIGTAQADTPQNGKTQAVELITARLESGAPIYEDGTWAGAPAVVGAWNDTILEESADAAALIGARVRSGQPVAEDLTWVGAPRLVGAYNDFLLAAGERDGLDGHELAAELAR